MKHRMDGRRLGLPTDQRMALLRNLVTSLLWHGSVTTTKTRAQEAERIAERLITLAKEDTLHRRRQAQQILLARTGLMESGKRGSYREAPAGGETGEALGGGRRASTVENSVNHLFTHVAPQFQDRAGGYTRIVPMTPRRGDGVLQVKLQLIDYRAPD